MSIQVVPYTQDRVPAVLAFNDRMAAAGATWGWYGSAVDEWLPERSGKKTWREHWLAVDRDAEVRGAYALKPHEWSVRGTPTLVTDWQGPVSEGLISPRYAALGLRLLREMLKQRPLLYSWGHGGLEQPMLQMLEKLGWLLHPTPFCIRVTHPFRFLRHNAFLRSTPARRLALDALAYSGMGSVGLHAWHALRASRLGADPPASVELFAEFGGWADDLWDRCRPAYSVIACRDASTMNTLLRPDAWPRGLKLKISRSGQVVGWAVVMDTQMTDDARFGSLRVGSIVDCLAAPSDAHTVVSAAVNFLRSRNVDLVVSNQSHPSWVDGFASNGFHLVPHRRVFAASPALRDALSPWPEASAGMHLTNMDGHGPMAL